MNVPMGFVSFNDFFVLRTTREISKINPNEKGVDGVAVIVYITSPPFN